VPLPGAVALRLSEALAAFGGAGDAAVERPGSKRHGQAVTAS
jgi:hypothetical protein